MSTPEASGLYLPSARSSTLGGSNLPRVEQRTTPDAVVAVLRAAILDGTLAPGQQLRESHLAADLGVSRAPLREAFSRLGDEGLIVKFPFRGSFVAEVKADVIDEIAGLRRRLEAFAVELSLASDRKLLLQRLRADVKALSGAADAGDLATSIDHHLAVHRLFYEMSGHRLLFQMWQEWEGQLRLFLALDHRTFEHLHDLGTDHEQLLKIVASGDMKAIAAELVGHVHGAVPIEQPAASPDRPRPKR